ncbi:MAG: hypothetical protein U9R34_03415, partial [Nanoarchaeota archaeon]|nr:hypothetical protein [Nanoarchaeota archaeon]
MDELSVKIVSSKNILIPPFKLSIVIKKLELVTSCLIIFQHVSMQLSCGEYGGINSINIFFPNVSKK